MLTISQIEYWALQVIGRVENKQPVEDSRVELKAGFVDATRAARRIAGHLNAARGDDVLWLIGVDEERGVVGVHATEFAGWYNGVRACFDDLVLAPKVVDVAVSTRAGTVVALLFDGSRVPYVVRNTSFGKSAGAAQFEVPWREATAVRSARHSDLIQILVPLSTLPRIEVRSGEFVSGGRFPNAPGRLELGLYIVPAKRGRIVIPFHRCTAAIRLAGVTDAVVLPEMAIDAPVTIQSSKSGYFRMTSESASLTMASTDSELLVDGPGRCTLRVDGIPLHERMRQVQTVSVTAVLRLATDAAPMVLDVPMMRSGRLEEFRFSFFPRKGDTDTQ